MNIIMRFLSVITLSLLSVVTQAEVKVENAWIRLLPPMVKTTAAYMDIVSTENDVLIGVSSSIAMMTEIHESSMNDGVMSMDHVNEIALEKDTTLSMKPGGIHIMLMNLHSPLQASATYKLVLEFKRAGAVEIQLPVRKQ